MRRSRLCACVSCSWRRSALAQHEHHGGMAPKDIGTVDFRHLLQSRHEDQVQRSRRPPSLILVRRIPRRCSKASSRTIRTARSRIGASRSRTGATRSPACASRRRLPTARPPSTRASPPARRPRARRATSTRSAILFSSADVTTQRQRVLDYERATRPPLGGQQGRCRGAHLLGACRRTGGIADRQDLRAATAGGRNSRADVRRSMPNHPGLAHYIIHAYDVPVLAPKALKAANAYAGIAPAVPHALHMPSHTFTRVGLLAGIGRQQHQVVGDCREDQRHR